MQISNLNDKLAARPFSSHRLALAVAYDRAKTRNKRQKITGQRGPWPWEHHKWYWKVEDA